MATEKPRAAVRSAGLRYVKTYRDRMGKMRRYYRRAGFPPAPLRGEPGSAEFLESYEIASGTAVKGVKRPKLGTIYVVQIRGQDMVKIGYGVNPDRRLQQIQHGAGMPGALVTLHRARGYRATERALHRQFAAVRLFGEWFRLAGPVAEWLETVAQDQAA